MDITYTTTNVLNHVQRNTGETEEPENVKLVTNPVRPVPSVPELLPENVRNANTIPTVPTDNSAAHSCKDVSTNKLCVKETKSIELDTKTVLLVKNLNSY